MNDPADDTAWHIIAFFWQINGWRWDSSRSIPLMVVKPPDDVCYVIAENLREAIIEGRRAFAHDVHLGGPCDEIQAVKLWQF